MELTQHLQAEKKVLEIRAFKAVQALKGNEFDAHYAPGPAEARELVLGLIPAGATVALGGSLTVRQLSLDELIRERGHTVYDRWRDPDLDLRKRLTADVFLASSNAVTMDGQLVNLDGIGSRASCLIFGPSKVIVVAGFNKIVLSAEEGLRRARNLSAPMNYQRKASPAPCARLGYCADCSFPAKQCRVVTILEGRPKGIRDYHVVIVGQSLGY